MKIIKEDVSFNSYSKTEVKYSRKIYHCVEDDVWINVEIPVKR